MFIIYFHSKCCISGFCGSLIIAVKLKIKLIFDLTTMLFYIMQNIASTEVVCSSEGLFLSGPYTNVPVALRPRDHASAIVLGCHAVA
jgi:hypothetical protein